MKKIAILALVAVADDTPDEQLANLTASVSAQVDDPVGGTDESGNEILIPSAGNVVTLFDADETLALLMATEVGLEGAPEEVAAADTAWNKINALKDL